MWVSTYILPDRQTDGQTDKTDRWTSRQDTVRWTNGQTHGQTDRQDIHVYQFIGKISYHMQSSQLKASHLLNSK